jgi:predicted amidohydrolase YtcJ
VLDFPLAFWVHHGSQRSVGELFRPSHILGFLAAVVAIIAIGGCAITKRVPTGRATLVILNGHVWTGAGAGIGTGAGIDREAEAIAIVGERIVAVGANDEIARWIDAKTIRIDAQNRRVIPGIIDSHAHIVSGGMHLGRLNLRSVGSKDEFIESVAQAVTADNPARWIRGGRWSVESWPDPAPPRKDWIDPATPKTPVFLERMDGHQGLANSIALKMAGIDRSGPPDPPGGVIVRDPNTHQPTGILKESAMELVTRHIPDPSEDETYAALLRAMKHVNANGITSMHDMSGPDDLSALFRAHREHRLTIRVKKYLSVPDWRDVIDVVTNFDVADDWLRVPGFKGYMDGSLGSRTAYMYRPYTDADSNAEYPCGILSDMAIPPKKIRHMIEVADKANLQCAVHAIGDEANHILLNAYESVARRNKTANRRHRAEHAQHLLPEDVPRFAELNVVASMQPYHKADDGRYGDVAIGADRLKSSYAYGSLLESGAILAFGSDWPVVTCNPFLGMWAAVTGETLDGKVWIPEERISIERALSAYTLGGAIAGRSESKLGTIEVGKLADLVVLSDDVLSVSDSDIRNIRAVLTIAGGRVVFDAGKLDRDDHNRRYQGQK